MTNKAVLIVNPAARGLPSRKDLSSAIDWMSQRGWEVSIALTRAPGHARDIARAAVDLGAALLLACGGDGTISEAVNGLAGSETALGVIPAGTARVWAKEVKLPRSPLAAVRIAIEGESRHIDLGRAGGRYFFLMAGIGLDGRVAGSVPKTAKRYLGATAYALTALKEVIGYRAAPVRVTIDGETIEARLLMMVVGNTRNYAGVAQVTRRALADDGLLDVCLFQGRGALDIVTEAAKVPFGLHLKSSRVVYRQARRVEIVTEAPLPMQIDGEYVEGIPYVFEVAPMALKVMAPRKAGIQIFTPS